MHFLSSKVAANIAKKKDLPFKKREFPKLTDLCVDVIVKNFDKYPGLEGVPQYYKNIVVIG
jgi:hypothetical protein